MMLTLLIMAGISTANSDVVSYGDTPVTRLFCMYQFRSTLKMNGMVHELIHTLLRGLTIDAGNQGPLLLARIGGSHTRSAGSGC
jgi:hypothetical protein